MMRYACLLKHVINWIITCYRNSGLGEKLSLHGKARPVFW